MVVASILNYFCKGFYLTTINIDVSDGLCNGSTGKLMQLDFDTKNIVVRVWLEFCSLSNIGRKKRKKSLS